MDLEELRWELEGAEERKQDELRLIGVVIRYLMAPHLTEKSAQAVTPLHITSNLPGFQYRDGEEWLPEHQQFMPLAEREKLKEQ